MRVANLQFVQVAKGFQVFDRARPFATLNGLKDRRRHKNRSN